MSQSTSSQRDEKHSLTVMSATVLSVLRAKQSASFADLAADVVQIFGRNNPDEEINERTITRRVYDVLNVFVAAGVVKKEGNLIRIPTEQRMAPGAQDGDEIRAVKARLALKEAALLEKARLLLYYRLIIQRNQSQARPLAAFELPVICVALRDTKNGHARRTLNGSRLEIVTKADPMFFSPMELFDQLKFSVESQMALARATPEIAALEPRLFPNGAAGAKPQHITRVEEFRIPLPFR
jgi:hypothetical protein